MKRLFCLAGCICLLAGRSLGFDYQGKKVEESKFDAAKLLGT
jgi:hypothetical protein